MIYNAYSSDQLSQESFFLLKILNESRLLLNNLRGILLFKTESLFASALRPTFFWFDLIVMNFDCLEVANPSNPSK